MTVVFKDYYSILGVDRKADAKTIKSAYRRLARKHHPDVAKGKDAERFKEIAEAYEVLSDPDKRRRYDNLGPDWQRYARSGPGVSLATVSGWSMAPNRTSPTSCGPFSGISVAAWVETVPARVPGAA